MSNTVLVLPSDYRLFLLLHERNECQSLREKHRVKGEPKACSSITLQFTPLKRALNRTLQEQNPP